MNYFDPNTRNPDGTYRYSLDHSKIQEVLRRQELGSEEVLADWQAPAEITELLDRVYPDGAPEAWTRFFAGEEIEDADRDKIRAALKGHAQRPPDSGLLGDERLLSARKEIESAMEKLSWLDAASEDDHATIILYSAGHVAEKLSERAGLELQKRSLDYLFEKTKDEIRAGARRAKDMHLLYLVCEAIVAPRRHTGFPDGYLSLLPPGTAETMRLYKGFYARRAESERQEKEAQRLKQIEEAEREKIERLAAIEEASFDDLLNLLFGHSPNSSILHSFRRREKLTEADLNLLIYLKDDADPVRRRGYERLFELGSSVGIKILSLEEIEEMQAARLREAEEAKERQTLRALELIEQYDFIALCAEAAARGLVPQEWQPWLHRVSDVERVTMARDHFSASAGRATDPVNRRICEMLASRLPSRNVGMPGAVGY
jgi:hypothetical protein